MFELPEYINFAKQINETVRGLTITSGDLGNSPHKFVWYNREPSEFSQLVVGKVVGNARVKGRWLFVPLEPGYTLLLGECGGRLVYYPPKSTLPKKYHLHLVFENAGFLTLTTQMWGAVELYAQGQEYEREYVKDMRPTPLDPEFSYDYFSSLITELSSGKKRSVKSLLTQEQLVPGLGNAIAQDILFHTRLHPKYNLADLSREQTLRLYNTILSTLDIIINKGGRYDEYDLYNQPGGYVRLMDRNAVGAPCPECDTSVEKVQYLGGTCYFCPNCQGM